MRDQVLLSSWIDWHQGELASIINCLVSTGLGFATYLISTFNLLGSASCKYNLGMCIRSLSISFRNWEFSDFCVADL